MDYSPGIEKDSGWLTADNASVKDSAVDIHDDDLYSTLLKHETGSCIGSVENVDFQQTKSDELAEHSWTFWQHHAPSSSPTSCAMQHTVGPTVDVRLSESWVL